jgi:hypothetical protein
MLKGEPSLFRRSMGKALVEREALPRVERVEEANQSCA